MIKKTGLMASRSVGEPEEVSSGLNLWLELADPEQMSALLLKLREQRSAIHTALQNLHYVHFARFVPTPDSAALQVITSFDGDLDAYVLDFVLALGDQFEMILSHVKNRPSSPVKDHPTQFLQFVKEHNLGYGEMGGGGIGLYSAYPQRTVIDVIGPSGMAPACVEPTEVVVDRSDVQANVLRGVGASLAWHMGLRFGSADRARALLGEFLSGSHGAPRLSNDDPWPTGRPPYILTLGFSYSGLLALNISAADQAAFVQAHRAFVDGPDKLETAMKVGDIGPSDPVNWQLGGSYPVDMFVSLYADDQFELDKWCESLRSRCKAHGVTEVNHPLSAGVLTNSGERKPHLVHFGYVDGLSQPRLAIVGEPASKTDMQPRAGVGEFLLGASYPNIFGGRDSLGGLSPALAQNATFAALRVMEQDVVGFETLLDEASIAHGVDREWLAAKLMGRWRDGTPLSQSPDRPLSEPGAPARDQFDYLPSIDNPCTPDDSAGLRCPVGAHVRRMNPRSSRVAGRPHSRRLLRRGMAYGSKYEAGGADDGRPRGLVGLFLCADLHRQFEFVLQQWAQGDRATHGVVGQQDPIIGAQAGLRDGQQISGEYRIPRPAGNAGIVLQMPRLVKTVGALYLFMPGLAGVRHLATLGGAPQFANALNSPLFPTQLRALLGGKELSDSPGTVATPDPRTFDPRAREFRDDPFPTYAWFRIHHPLIELPLMKSTWVFSHRHLTIVTRDRRFRKRKSDDKSPAGLLNMDPPPHTGCRAAIEPLFATTLARVAPGIASVVEKCYADNCQNKGDVRALDWITEFAQPVAQAVFFNLFGLTVQEASELIKKVEAILAIATPASDELAKKEFAEKLEAIGVTLFLNNRFDRVPGRLFDLILGMTTLYDPGSNKKRFGMSALQVEQIANALSMVMAGFLPLQWFIALATWRLLQNDAVLLRQLKEDQAITNRDVVDELLRFDMSAPLSDRYASQDVEVDGVQFVQNQRLTLVWASASHDQAEFGPNADTINLKRRKGPGWAFGDVGGEHGCIGREMVYQVMEPVIQKLREATPPPRLAKDFVPTWGIPSQGAMFRIMTTLMVHC